MAWPISMILVSFCRILNGLLDEVNLFWCCSSPLKVCRQWKDIALSMRNGFGSNQNDAMFDVFDIKVNSQLVIFLSSVVTRDYF